MGWILSLPKGDQVLIPSTSECGLVRKENRVFADCNQVKMKSLEWILIQYDCVLKKREICGQRQTRTEGR